MPWRAPGTLPFFGLKDGNMRYLVNQIEDTHVVIGETSVYRQSIRLEYLRLRPACDDPLRCHGQPRRQCRQSRIRPLPVWEDPTKDDICND